MPLARGVGDTSDLRPYLRVYTELPGALIAAKPGVYYSDNTRRYLYSQGFSESFGVNSERLRHYRLSYTAASPVRANVYIRTSAGWKPLTPLYNCVVMQYCGYWQQRVDGLWETPIDLVYPMRVYDLEGNGYYPVEELREVREHAYYLDAVNRRIVSAVPGLMMDGLRTSPTVQVYERVYPEGKRVRSRWSPDVRWAFGILPDGNTVLPYTIEGNVWSFHESLPGSLVLSYYVLNTFCLFGDVLEIFTEPCHEIHVQYDIAESGSDYLVYDYLRPYFDFRGMQLVCVSPVRFTRVSTALSVGRTPARLEFHPMVEPAAGPLGGVTVLGVRALDESGQPVPGVRVQFSSPHGSFRNYDYYGNDLVTDQFGDVSAMFWRTGDLQDVSITVNAPEFPGVAVSGSVGLVGSTSGNGFQWIYERKSGDSEDILIILVFDEHGSPVSGLSSKVECLSGHLFRVPGREGSFDKANIVSEESAVDSGLVILVPKDPLTLKIIFTSRDRQSVCFLEGV